MLSQLRTGSPPRLAGSALLLVLFLGADLAAGEPGDQDRLWRYSRTLLESGDHAQAALEFKRFRTFFPDSERAPWASLLEGISLVQAGQFEKARSRFTTLETSVQDPFLARRAKLELGKSHYFEGEPEEAERVFLDMIKNAEMIDRETAAEAAFYLGWVRLERDEGDAAATLFSAIPDGSQFAAQREDLASRARALDRIDRKSPLKAGLLGAVLPGAGHAYLGRWADAATSLILNGLFGYAAYEGFRRDLPAVGGIAGFVGLSWYAGSIYGAVGHAHRHNEDLLDSYRDQFPVKPGQEKLLVPE